MSTSNTELPSVSIIAPVYNAEKEVDKLLDSLMNLEYPQDLLEIIIVDNKSTDNTSEIIKKYPVKRLDENEIQSSYAARNKGIKYANGYLLVFIDSDCIASSKWLNEGIKLFSDGADLVGGKVEFYFSEKETAAEMYDSMTNMQVEHNIRDRKVAKTANLFVRSSLFDEIGMFPDNVTSGGDVQWTARATRAGYKLVYAPEAVVKHPTRKLKELLKKQYRVGKGKMKALNSEDRDSDKKSLLKSLFPKIADIKNLINERGNKGMNKKLLRVWCVAFLCNVATGFGILAISLSNLKKGK
ncbi:glycosyltransferase [Methanococcoides alaskense]|uniref:Glycosyltransferase involved in cell wall biosynthesis n=1 Tax=Methanococcoides alaskense TaxID=325778 RepID=A0AA90TZZ6_9EURY|nr:glycosyltransferase [Methanococcoides alaskense]MDA0524843.1 glycosyltransferase [Methanococcoides alaskense]MDR6223031.1 glycosyltransferase involved in cell wall biosynthesis [Methanococcoides alaskense]